MKTMVKSLKTMVKKATGRSDVKTPLSLSTIKINISGCGELNSSNCIKSIGLKTDADGLGFFNIDYVSGTENKRITDLDYIFNNRYVIKNRELKHLVWSLDGEWIKSIDNWIEGSSDSLMYKGMFNDFFNNYEVDIKSDILFYYGVDGVYNQIFKNHGLKPMDGEVVDFIVKNWLIWQGVRAGYFVEPFAGAVKMSPTINREEVLDIFLILNGFGNMDPLNSRYTLTISPESPEATRTMFWSVVQVVKIVALFESDEVYFKYNITEKRDQKLGEILDIL